MSPGFLLLLRSGLFSRVTWRETLLSQFEGYGDNHFDILRLAIY